MPYKIFKKKHRKFISSEWVAFVYNHFIPNIFSSFNKMSPIDVCRSTYFSKYKCKT